LSVLTQLNAEAWIAYCVFAGLCIGSFLNVVAYRLPIMMEAQWEADLREAKGEEPLTRARFNLLLPRSHCPACKTPIKPWHNIPVISFILLKGKCAHCNAHFGWRYPVIELFTGLCFGILASMYPPSFLAFALMGLSAALIVLALIDLDTFLLPDAITLPLIWLGLLVNMISGAVSLDAAVLGAVAGYMILWLIYHLFKLATGKEGMGYGDFKLLAAAGAWFGFTSLFSVLLVSSVAGVVFGLIIQKIRGVGHAEPFPFGPSLVFGTFCWMAGLDVTRLLM
jgi:leader peptidase (prepilin peptidase) / N-methyltransferase